jgi:hypothetical protein
MLGGLLLGAVLGFFVGLFAGLAGAANSPIAIALSTILGAAAGVGWLIVVVRMALRKRYRGFRIALIPLDEAAL